MKVDGEKGLAVMLACSPRGEAEGREDRQGDERETPAICRDGAWVATKLTSITKRAQENPKGQWTSLAYLLNEGFLKNCFLELERDKASGIDGVGVNEYGVKLEENLKDLVTRMKSKSYRPQAVRRVYIPKADGTKRPLGIPAVEDKIVQMGLKKILEAIYEVDFLDVSYGFRPNRSCHQALNAVDKAIMTKPINFVVDMDIEKFFDTIDHKKMVELLSIRIKDPSILRLIVRFLKSGIMDEGKYIETDKGTPQGGVLSPLLANVYLHYVLDLWFEETVKKQLRGYAQMVRYADDFVVCFQSGREAKSFVELLKARLAEFGLKIAEGKFRVIEFGRYVWMRAEQSGGKIETFDFLGFTHYCDRTRKGGFKLGRKTARKSFRRKIKAMNVWLKSIRNAVKLEEWWPVLCQKLTGHYRYYGVSGNFFALNAFHSKTVKRVYKWINRRSQRKSYDWSGFNRFIRFNPLPRPRIYYSLYTLSL